MTGVLVPRRSRALVVLVVLALAASWLLVAAPRAHALNGKILIIDTTLDSGANFNEVDIAASLGLGADVVSQTGWASMTTAEFAQYRAIVFGDPNCVSDDDVRLSEPLLNLATWTPAVTGNVIVHTFDSVDHANESTPTDGAIELTTKGLAFATAQADKTGMYLSSSCYNETTWLDVLDGISSGWARVDQSTNSMHVVGSTPALAGLTDAALSDWGQSAHNLVTAWPSDFTVFAIATGTQPTEEGVGADDNGPSANATIPLVYTAPDGTQGAPVILIRGVDTSPSHILLQPATQSHEVGGTAELEATITEPDAEVVPVSVVGVAVTFTATAGPNVGKTTTAVTDASGVATISYSSATAGTDTWEASYVDPGEITETSNSVSAEWTAAAPAAVVVTPRFTG